LNSPWYKVSHKATEDPRFRWCSPKAQTLFFHLCRLRNRSNGHKWIQYNDERLAYESGLSARSVMRARNELEMSGFIKYQTTKNHKACRYLVIDDPERNAVPINVTYPQTDATEE
jgi:hypothetical protein